ncbi:MAG TPA: 16S rRNA (cytidine(1402)-2'-O)-methyltransferase [Hyphomicrobiaceae bacterium]|nr:16S rRNA (cytidine(1402)-2'-O)-methyltransferase [Hyphomicrobiaceae bacterium]
MKRQNPGGSSGQRRATACGAPSSAAGPQNDPAEPSDDDRTLVEAIQREAERQLSRPLAPGLSLVATPIGNLGDISLRAIATIARSDIVLCEDTRHSRALASHYGVRARLEAYHEHNAAEMRPRVLDWLAHGRRVALISDAGTPLISDPGFKLVRDALAAGHRVHAIPGPCAAVTALSSAGLPTDSFYFAGFLPPRNSARGARIAELADIPATLIFYEAPQRVAEALADLAAILGPRPAVIARELTKLNEEVQRGTLSNLAQMAASRDIKGEIVLLVGPPAEPQISDDIIRARLATALASSSLRDAARAVARDLGITKSRVYALGVDISRGTALNDPCDDGPE